jgi:hypothetical protein
LAYASQALTTALQLEFLIMEVSDVT